MYPGLRPWFERRREQQHEPLSRRTSRRSTAAIAWRARRVAATAQHRPGLRDRIDPAFAIRRRAQRRAVVEVGAPIPSPSHASSAAAFKRHARFAVTRARSCSPRASASSAKRGSTPAEPGQPDAFALPVFADAVHPVIPVACADERQAVRPAVEADVDGARAVLEQRAPLDRRGRRAGTPRARRARAAGRRETAPPRRGPRGRRWTRRNASRRRSTRGGRRRTASGRRARRLVPPVLHVALDELPGGCVEQMARASAGSSQSSASTSCS